MPELRLVHSVSKKAAGKIVCLPPNQGDDHALVAGILRGGGAAATALVERYRPLVERTLVRMLGFDSDLADLVQESFIRIFDSLRLVRDPQALPKWIIRITACTAADHLRRRTRWRWLSFGAEAREQESQLDHAMFELEPDLEARRALQAAQAVLTSLPVDERLAFCLRRLEGMELKDVAHACGCSLATIKRRLAKAEERFYSRGQKYPELVKWLSQANGGEQ
jgi:RNA polymerase sigma-70 factor (ECF subfamily)